MSGNDRYLAEIRWSGDIDCSKQECGMPSRRSLLKKGVASALVSAVAPWSVSRPPMKRVLVLGGTYFLGPAIVAALLKSGHEVTLFNRGKTNPELFPQLEKLRGDRQLDREDLRVLAGRRRWDVVVDVWPSEPMMTSATASLLADRVERYLYVSSIVAYANLRTASAPVAEDAALRDVAQYVPNLPYEQGKALSEHMLDRIMPGRNAVLRPTGIVGERDDEIAMIYWLWRMRRGGAVLAPGDDSDPVQWIDVKDVGELAARIVASASVGAFNAVGPQNPITLSGMLNEMNAHFGARAQLRWVSNYWLDSQQIRSGIDLPMWRPPAQWGAFYRISPAKSLATGLSLRPAAATFDAALGWYDLAHAGSPDPRTTSVNRGITVEREAQLLQAWDAAGHRAA
jgi:nucleoside-diphosphate-sugar epimerase